MRSPTSAELNAMKSTEALLETARLKCHDSIVLLQETLNPLAERWADSSVEVFFPFARLSSWLHTALKFDKANDYQAAAAAARTLFEIAVDTTLIQLGGEDHDRIGAWERSAKFKAAAKVVSEYGRDPKEAPELVRPFIELFLQEESKMEKLRLQWWHPKKSGAGRHPPRWTDDNLESDAARADALYPEALFGRWYLWKYSFRCVAVHGSGSGGLRDGHAFGPALITAQALLEAAHFALVAAEMIAELWGTNHGLTIRTYRAKEIPLGHLITDPPSLEVKREIARIKAELSDTNDANCFNVLSGGTPA